MKMKAMVILASMFFVLQLKAQTIHPDLTSAGNFVAVNRQVIISTKDDKNIVQLNSQPNDGIAWVKNVSFSTGTIAFDVKGKNVLQESFVGIAFHGINDSSFDAIYFRPFNFQSNEAVRKSHSVQYICMPKYDWSYLRETFPGKYENALVSTIDPDAWFHVKIIVKKDVIEVYVNNDIKSSLQVQPIMHYTEGKIGFWVGNNSDGSFSNLTIQNN
ncbi:MAG: hypothetical protein QM802_19435 [Agriterribacter sp.]